MAEIHLAKTKGIAGFEKYVALKMIHPNFAEDEQFIQMLVDEAKIAVQLNHGNIAQTFDLGRVGDTYYITMEYVDGADLYKILRKGSETDGFEMPLDVAAFIGKEIASVNSYWQQQVFSGRASPPVVKPSDAEVVAYVAATPGAIGYVAADATVAGVKVLTVTP